MSDAVRLLQELLAAYVEQAISLREVQAWLGRVELGRPTPEGPDWDKLATRVWAIIADSDAGRPEADVRGEVSALLLGRLEVRGWKVGGSTSTEALLPTDVRPFVLDGSATRFPISITSAVRYAV